MIILFTLTSPVELVDLSMTNWHMNKYKKQDTIIQMFDFLFKVTFFLASKITIAEEQFY